MITRPSSHAWWPRRSVLFFPVHSAALLLSEDLARQIVRGYRGSLQHDRRHVLEGYNFTDMAWLLAAASPRYVSDNRLRLHLHTRKYDLHIGGPDLSQ